MAFKVDVAWPSWPVCTNRFGPCCTFYHSVKDNPIHITKTIFIHSKLDDNLSGHGLGNVSLVTHLSWSETYIRQKTIQNKFRAFSVSFWWWAKGNHHSKFRHWLRYWKVPSWFDRSKATRTPMYLTKTRCTAGHNEVTCCVSTNIEPFVPSNWQAKIHPLDPCAFHIQVTPRVN